MTLENPKHSAFLEALEILYRWRKLMLMTLAAATVVAVVVSLLLPKWYKASASVLSPKQQDLFGSLSAASSVLKNITGAGKLGGLGQKSSAYNYFAILNSRSAMETVVRKFDLIRVYDVSDSSMENAVRLLSHNVAFEEQSDDYISISVLDRDPQRAADMANFFVEVLNVMSVRLGTEEAGSNREFIGQRLEQTRADLRAAEDTLRTYQEKVRLIITPEESSSMSAVASLYAMRAKKEIELAILRHNVSEDSPSLQEARVELTELDRKLGRIPEVGLESLRRYRDVMIQQRILEFLVPLYEQARIDEMKDIPVVLVLDKAIPPERRVSPQRSLIVLLTFTLVLFALIPFVFILHGILSRGPSRGEVGSLAYRSALAITRFYRLRDLT